MSEVEPTSVGPSTGGLWFGEFEILERLGRGGMATVVRARSPVGSGLPPIVALKFLRRELLELDDAVDAFRNEALLGMRARHPNLCDTYGYEVIDGRAAIVLEYVEGSSLSKLQPYGTKRGFGFDDQVAIAGILAKVCRALHALHETTDAEGSQLGAVHRDVTPQNVIITPSGTPKVIDLGVAFSHNRTKPTAQGLLKGKVAYLPPEYLLGLAWDRRLDIWSVGVLAWELLTGRRLFKRDELGAMVRAIVNSDPDVPSSIRPHLDPGIDCIVMKALTNAPEKRYRTAEEMALALEHFVGSSLEFALDDEPAFSKSRSFGVARSGGSRV